MVASRPRGWRCCRGTAGSHYPVDHPAYQVQEVRLKQQAAARKGERPAVSGQRSVSTEGSGVGVPALAGDRAGKPPEGGTPTRREMSRPPGAFAEESIGVDQTGFERESMRPPAAHAGVGGIEERDDAVAEETKGVDQSQPAKAGTPTSAALAEDRGPAWPPGANTKGENSAPRRRPHLHSLHTLVIRSDEHSWCSSREASQRIGLAFIVRLGFFELIYSSLGGRREPRSQRAARQSLGTREARLSFS